MTTELDCIEVLCIAYKVLRGSGQKVDEIMNQLCLAEDELENGDTSSFINVGDINHVSIGRMLHRISNSSFDELDDAILHLKRSRESRAYVRASVAFSPGDRVIFPWTTDKGRRTVTGTFVQPSKSDVGKIEVNNVHDLHGLPIGGSTYVVDAAKVDHADKEEL